MWAELREDEVDDPVREGCDGIAEGSDFDGEDFGWVAGISLASLIAVLVGSVDDIHPGDNAQGCVEKGEDEVHRHHGSQLISVAGIEVLAQCCVDDEGGGQTAGRHDQRLHAADLIENEEADGAVDDGEGSTDADDHERCLGLDV